MRVEAYDRKRLEQLCRYITWRAASEERVQLNARPGVTSPRPHRPSSAMSRMPRLDRTCISRMAGSLLTAVGLPDQIAFDLAGDDTLMMALP